MLYLLDANVLIDARRDYYPPDRVPQFWQWLVDMGTQGRVRIPREIFDDIVRGNDELVDWLKRHKPSLVLDEYAPRELVAYVTEQGYARDLADDEIEKIGSDAFLIAHALADAGNRCVVTTESSKPSRTRANRHVPDVCRDLDVDCIDTFQLIRRLDFRTNLSGS